MLVVHLVELCVAGVAACSRASERYADTGRAGAAGRGAALHLPIPKPHAVHMQVVRGHFELRESRLELQAEVELQRAEEASVRLEARHWHVHQRAPPAAELQDEAAGPMELPPFPEGGVSIGEWQQMLEFEQIRIKQLKEEQTDCRGRISRLQAKLHADVAVGTLSIQPVDAAEQLSELIVECEALRQQLREKQVTHCCEPHHNLLRCAGACRMIQAHVCADGRWSLYSLRLRLRQSCCLIRW